MQFTGRNLELVREAIGFALTGIKTEIGCHPAPLEFEEDIEAMEKLRDELIALAARIDAKVTP